MVKYVLQDNHFVFTSRCSILIHASPPRVHYKDPTGKIRDWESCERTTRPEGTELDGVGIVAILEKPTGTYIFMIFCDTP